MDVQQLRRTPAHVIQGDVEPSMGVVELPGDLIVRGNVQDDSLVFVEGDITVHGYVGAAAVRSTRNIRVHQGVAGHSYLDAGGDIAVRFASNSRLVAGGSIHVTTSAMHCILSAEDKIEVKGGEGFLVGGTASARSRVVVHRLGSIHSTPTIVRVGVSPLLRHELQRLTEEIDGLNKRLEQVRKDIAYLERSGHDSRYVDQLPLYRLRAAYLDRELQTQSRRYQMTRRELDKAGQVGDVQVQGIVHPGVDLYIGWEEYPVREAFEQVRFYEAEGGIQWARFASESIPVPEPISA